MISTEERAYGPRFWYTYVANMALTVTVSLMFRYANFVAILGGSEQDLGQITGLGMLGAICARCVLGQAIDAWGAGKIWLFSLLLLVSCLPAHLWVTDIDGPLIYVLRILYIVSLAGAFTSSITFVSLRVGPERMGEMIGMLGSSGFIGMGIGPWLGDMLLENADPKVLSAKLFFWSAGAAFLSLLFCLFATLGAQKTVKTNGSDNPHLFRIVRRYHPGWSLLVGCAMGVGIGIPGTFLSAFVDAKGFPGMSWYWIPYTMVAFVVRILARTLPDTWGTRPTSILGLACMSASMFSYLQVDRPVLLCVPAVLGGMAHAFLFPAALSEGGQSFPTQYRGIATTLMLMMFDIGLFVGQPVFGTTVEWSRHANEDGYAVAFSMLGVFFVVVAGIYRLMKTPKIDNV